MKNAMLASLSSTVLLIALGATPAFGQDEGNISAPPIAQGGDAALPAGQAAGAILRPLTSPAGDARQDKLAADPFTAADVDPNDPFGSIEFGDVADDIASNPAAMLEWRTTLTHEERVEMDNRCSVIGDDDASYDDATQTFCETWVVVAADNMGEPAPADAVKPLVN